METKTINCTNCGAPLDFKGSQGPTMRCPYCSASVAVPPEFRTGSSDQPRSGGLGRGILLSLGGIAVIAVALILLLLPKSPSADSNTSANSPAGATQAIALALPTRTPLPPTAVPTPGFAKQVLAFVSQGIAPGMLNRATNIAVDGGQVAVFVMNDR